VERSDVLAASQAAAQLAGFSVELLPTLRDLDTPADASALRADPRVPTTVAALLSPATV
jgi:hypothetical protein